MAVRPRCQRRMPVQRRLQSGSAQCFAKCPFPGQFDRLSDQLCQSLDRLSDQLCQSLDRLSNPLCQSLDRPSDHFAKHCADGMAAVVRGGAARGGRPFYNGLHLRLEADASAWIASAGGHQAFWDRCAAQGLGSDTWHMVWGLVRGIGSRVGCAAQGLGTGVRHRAQSRVPGTGFGDWCEAQGCHFALPLLPWAAPPLGGPRSCMWHMGVRSQGTHAARQVLGREVPVYLSI